MSKIIQLVVINFSLLITTLSYSQNSISISKYTIDINLQDTSISIDASLSIVNNKQQSYLLFNSDIFNYELKTNDINFIYVHKNDTILFISKIDTIRLNIKYDIPWYRINGDNLQAIRKSDKFQVFFERYYKWYPLLYDNFSNFKLSINTDNSFGVFAYTSADSIISTENRKTYFYNLYDEDFPFLISKLDVFNNKTIKYKGTNYNFYFLKNTKRLLEVKNNKPIFTFDSIKVDSINNHIYNRCINITQWYQTNLKQKEIKNIDFIESTSTNMGGFGLNNLIYLNTQMINYDLYYKYQISHEIGHIWIGLNTKYKEVGRGFMSESINEYVNLLLYEDFFGKQEFDKLLKQEFILSSSHFTCSLNDVLKIHKNFNLINQEQVNIDVIIYKKGPLFLNEFRNKIGKEMFLKIINDTYTQEKKLITLNDFERSIKKHNSWKSYLELFELKL